MTENEDDKEECSVDILKAKQELYHKLNDIKEYIRKFENLGSKRKFNLESSLIIHNIRRIIHEVKVLDDEIENKNKIISDLIIKNENDDTINNLKRKLIQLNEENLNLKGNIKNLSINISELNNKIDQYKLRINKQRENTGEVTEKLKKEFEDKRDFIISEDSNKKSILQNRIAKERDYIKEMEDRISILEKENAEKREFLQKYSPEKLQELKDLMEAEVNSRLKLFAQNIYLLLRDNIDNDETYDGSIAIKMVKKAVDVEYGKLSEQT